MSRRISPQYRFVGYVAADGSFRETGDMGTRTFNGIFARMAMYRPECDQHACEYIVLENADGFLVTDILRSQRRPDGELVPVVEQTFAEEAPAAVYVCFRTSMAAEEAL